MGAPAPSPAAALPPPASGRARGVALALWILFGLVLWNAVFDHGIRTASRSVVDRQLAFTLGHGPRILLGREMPPAIAQAARRATRWTALAVAPGLILLAGTGLASGERRRTARRSR